MKRIYGTPNSPIGRNLLKERKTILGTRVPGYLLTQDLLHRFCTVICFLFTKQKWQEWREFAQDTKSFIYWTNPSRRERD